MCGGGGGFGGGTKARPGLLESGTGGGLLYNMDKKMVCRR